MQASNSIEKAVTADVSTHSQRPSPRLYPSLFGEDDSSDGVGLTKVVEEDAAGADGSYVNVPMPR